MIKVMIVDDLAENLYLLKTLLAGNGYEVITARNGKEALASARESAPDMIISDILMPVMDGFTLCREWRQDEKLRKLPFVFYTATYTEPEDESFAKSLGADLFITKPTETDAFLALIRDALERYGSGRSPNAGMRLASDATYLKEYNEVLIHKLEEKLVQLENANRALALKDFAIESSISGIVMADLSGNMTYANDSCSVMWGCEKSDLIGKHVSSLVKDPGAFLRITAEFREKKSWLGEIDARRKDGTAFIALVAAHSIKDPGDQIVGMMMSCIDVTERKRMQEELQRNQKLESLNVFAGGIAHDFNNLLTGLFGNIQLARKELPPASAAGKYLDEVAGVLERAKDLSHRLLTYAKGRSARVEEVRVEEILRECCVLSLSGSNIRNEIEFSDGLWTVRADGNQLSQVFNNIIINARQAMKNGGSLKISIQNRDLEANQVGTLAPGRYVAIAVKDEGVGIPHDIISRIFDPFFTTKPDGSGLGLATSYAIVKYHGGDITVKSEPGMGSTFTVWLPAYLGTGTSIRQRYSFDGIRGEGRILFMDDERVIRNLAKAMLELGGYKVVVVANGREAIEVYKKAAAAGDQFSAVILDLTVRGGMGGIETASELLRTDPGAAIIMSSGYSDDAAIARLREIGCVELIPKPYMIHELLGTVKRALTRHLDQPPA